MTLYEHKKQDAWSPGRAVDFTVVQASGADDPRASDAGRALMNFVHERTGGGARLLKRSDFSPMDIKPYLTNIMILDMICDDKGAVLDGVIRLMGSNVAAYYGEFTGKLISEHASEAGERFVASAQAVIDANGPSIGRSDQSIPDGERLSVKTCWIPISDAGGAITQVLGHIQLFNYAGEPLPSL